MVSAFYNYSTNNGNYLLGNLSNGKRVINVTNVAEMNSLGISKTENYICDTFESSLKNKNTLDGKLGRFNQNNRGDCYFISSLIALNNSNAGKKIIEDCIKINDDGTYTVKLPGALKANEVFTKKYGKENCSITGEYIISQDAIKKASSSSSLMYASGDKDVIALELALESYRAEVNENTRKNNLEKYINCDMVGIGNYKENDLLTCGNDMDALFLLTGKSSNHYENTEYPSEILNEEKMEAPDGLLASINKYSNTKDALEKMLNKCAGNEEDYAITVGFCVEDRKKIGKIVPKGENTAPHMFSISKITDEYVEVIDPLDTEHPQKLSRKEFSNLCQSLSYVKLNESFSDKCKKIIDSIKRFFNS